MMVMYNELPIYKSCYSLLLDVTRMCKKLPQMYRYNVGQHLHTSLTELVVLLFKANSYRDQRKLYLGQAKEQLELVRLLIRLCKDLGGIAYLSYVDIQPKIEEISKQLSGWDKSTL